MSRTLHPVLPLTAVCLLIAGSVGCAQPTNPSSSHSVASTTDTTARSTALMPAPSNPSTHSTTTAAATGSPMPGSTDTMQGSTDTRSAATEAPPSGIDRPQSTTDGGRMPDNASVMANRGGYPLDADGTRAARRDRN